MKDRKVILMFVFIVVIIFGVVLMTHNEADPMGKTLVQSDEAVAADSYHYYAKNQDGCVIVYNKDHTVYEYTDLVPDYLPEKIKNNLNLGIYFQNQEELYEFLETYSS